MKTKRSVEVAETRRLVNALEGKQGRNYRELQDAIEYMKEKRSGLLETMERKHKLRNRSSERSSNRYCPGSGDRGS